MRCGLKVLDLLWAIYISKLHFESVSFGGMNNTGEISSNIRSKKYLQNVVYRSLNSVMKDCSTNVISAMD